MPRTNISKKLRFEVFKRDGFVCQYCGATPPRVVLHVDHIHPVSKGGGNHIDNLITACEPCNIGKSATPLSVVPKSLKEKADEAAEREEQIKRYNAVLAASMARVEGDAWDIAARLECVERLDSYDRAKLQSIKTFVRRLPLFEVEDAVDIALAKKRSGHGLFQYFCGVCWAKIRESNG